jgi:hypothetical protein
MKPWQKYVRIGAIIFAVVIILNIVFLGLRFVGVFLGVASVVTDEEAQVHSFDSEAIDTLEIDISAAQFHLKETNGDKITVKSNINGLEAKESGGALRIKEKKSLLSLSDTEAIVEIFYPTGFLFDEVEINGGAGRLTITGLTAERIDFDLGAGDTSIDRLIVTQKADIDGGAGTLLFTRTEISYLDLEMGVGHLSFNGILNEKSNISLGVGEAVFEIYGAKEKYYIDVSKGLGDVDYYGVDPGNFEREGKSSTVKIDGGIGKISVSLKGDPENW